MVSPQLVIGMPCRAEIRASVFPQLLQCIIQAGAYWHRRYGDALVSTQIMARTHVVTARNAIVAEARELEAEWILWLDDDMSPPPDLLERLHSTGEPFVGAVAYKREPPYQPCVFRLDELKAVPFDPEPEAGLVDADLTGFACILTHRSVYDAVWDRTDGHPFALQGKNCGEDFYFCLQARKAGFQLRILADCTVGHAGDLIVGREHRLAALAQG
jgi:glycosyltransferase involved in cell wall biosynthesis